MMGLTLSHRQKRCITSKPASYSVDLMYNPVAVLVLPPLISIKLTVKGGEKDWIT